MPRRDYIDDYGLKKMSFQRDYGLERFLIGAFDPSVLPRPCLGYTARTVGR